MTEILKNLCNVNGISGREDEVRKLILSEIEPFAQCRVDALGNIIAFKKGKNAAASKVMLAAHMDEVGFMVNYITESGYVKITPVGGIDQRVVYGRRVIIGKNKITGVIGAKAVHLLSGDEKNKVPDFSEMYVDIGVESREEAEKYVSLGDSVYFDSDIYPFGDGFIKGKAIDDRAGCAILIDMIKQEQPYDLYFVFTVQEEVGLRGAGTAAFGLQADAAFAVDATGAADIPLCRPQDYLVCLGGGVGVSAIDAATITPKWMLDDIISLCRAENIRYQVRIAPRGGNDAGAIHRSRTGIASCALSIPTRNIHSNVEVTDINDIRAAVDLLCAVLEKGLRGLK